MISETESLAGEALAKSGRFDRLKQFFPVSWLLPLAAIVIPIIAFAISSGGDWFFDWGGADNWQYLLHFQGWTNSSEATQASTLSDYKGARIAWIAFGWIFHSLFSPMVAQVLVTTLTFVGGQIALYAVLRALCERRIAIVILALSSAYTGLHSAHGGALFWNYHASFANAAFLAGIAAFLSVRRERWLVASAVAGASFAVALSTTFLLAVLGLGLVAMLVIGVWRRPDAPWLRAIGVMVAGFLLTLMVMGLISVAVGGDFLFYTQQLNFTNRALAENPWWVPWGDWFPTARFMGFIIGTAVIAALGVVVWFFRRKNLNREVQAGILFGLLFGVLCTAGELILELRGQNVLSTSYVAYHLVAPGFIVIAAASQLLVGDFRVARFELPVWSVVLVVLLITILIQILLSTPDRSRMLRDLATLSGLPDSIRFPAVLAIVVVATVAVGCVIGRWLGGGWAVFLAVGLSLVSAMATSEGKQYALAEQRCGAAAEQFTLVARFSEWAAKLNHSDLVYTAWMSPNTKIEWTRGCPVSTPALLATLTYAAKWVRLPDVPATPTPKSIFTMNFKRWGVVLITRPNDADRAYQDFVAYVLASAPGSTVAKAETRSFYADRRSVLQATVVLVDINR